MGLLTVDELEAKIKKLEEELRRLKNEYAERVRPTTPREECDNEKYGFECSCKWERENPGDIKYNCPYCGMYVASRPRCGDCQEDLKQ